MKIVRRFLLWILLARITPIPINSSVIRAFGK